MAMKDRLFNGFLAGFLGSIVPVAINFGTLALGINTVLWADYMSTFILGRKPQGAFEIIIFVTVQFIFLGFLGAVFSTLLPFITSKHLFFKGALYGLIVWFILFSLPYLLQLPYFAISPLRTALIHSISASSWGLMMAYVLKEIDNKIGQQ